MESKVVARKILLKTQYSARAEYSKNLRQKFNSRQNCDDCDSFFKNFFADFQMNLMAEFYGDEDWNYRPENVVKKI